MRSNNDALAALSPREQFTIYDPPVITNFTAGQWTGEVAREDPDRVVLIIGTSAGGQVSLMSGQTQGITANDMLVLDLDHHRRLVGSSWYAITAGAVTGTVIELCLRRDPATLLALPSPPDVSAVRRKEPAGSFTQRWIDILRRYLERSKGSAARSNLPGGR